MSTVGDEVKPGVASHPIGDAVGKFDAGLPQSSGNSLIYGILQNLPAALYICDARGEIQFFNESAAALWGRRAVSGERWTGAHRSYWPDGSPIPPSATPMAQAVRERQSVRGQEIIIERPDGTRRHVLPHPELLRDSGGNLVGVINMLVDITEHKRAEEAQSRLAAIVESSDDAVISKTLEGIITSWNGGAQRLFGYTAEEAIGKHITLLIPPDRFNEEAAILQRLCRGERIDHYETIRVAKDGRLIDISLTISPVRDGSGRIIGASKIARDITARRKAEDSAKEADRRKDEFLAMLAHELRNPLAPLRSGLQIIELSDSGNKVIEHTRRIMQRQVDQMVRLVDDLLDVSRISRGKLELRKERVTLASVVQVAVETCDPAIKQHGHSLSVKLPAEAVYIDADPVRMAQAIGNLLTNAAKFTPDGGRIWLDAKPRDGKVVISVRDTGCGIPPDMLASVFDMFTQIERLPEKPQSGLGIGLTLVKRLLELHGGAVEARSEGPGKGSEFILTLPLLESERGTSAAGERAGQEQRAGKRVLVADDNRDAADCLAMMLEMMGNEVRTAHDGNEAVQLAEAFKPEVILLDLGMPGVDGYTAARLIRSQPWGARARLIALTGWGQDEDRQRTKAAGFDYHVVKPADPDELEKLMNE